MEDWRTEASSSGRKKGPSGRIWWRLAAAVVEGWEPVVLEERCLAKAGTGAGGSLLVAAWGLVATVGNVATLLGCWLAVWALPPITVG